MPRCDGASSRSAVPSMELLAERPATLWCLGETQGPADETHLSFEIAAGAKSATLSAPIALVQRVLHAAHRRRGST